MFSLPLLDVCWTGAVVLLVELSIHTVFREEEMRVKYGLDAPKKASPAPKENDQNQILF